MNESADSTNRSATNRFAPRSGTCFGAPVTSGTDLCLYSYVIGNSWSADRLRVSRTVEGGDVIGPGSRSHGSRYATHDIAQYVVYLILYRSTQAIVVASNSRTVACEGRWLQSGGQSLVTWLTRYWHWSNIDISILPIFRWIYTYHVIVTPDRL